MSSTPLARIQSIAGYPQDFYNNLKKRKTFCCSSSESPKTCYKSDPLGIRCAGNYNKVVCTNYSDKENKDLEILYNNNKNNSDRKNKGYVYFEEMIQNGNTMNCKEASILGFGGSKNKKTKKQKNKKTHKKK